MTDIEIYKKRKSVTEFFKLIKELDRLDEELNREKTSGPIVTLATRKGNRDGISNDHRLKNPISLTLLKGEKDNA